MMFALQTAAPLFLLHCFCYNVMFSQVWPDIELLGIFGLVGPEAAGVAGGTVVILCLLKMQDVTDL